MRLPEVMLSRARYLATGEGEPWQPPPLRDASTVVLLREDDGLEAFIMRRHSTMAFAPGMYVFAGGSVDARDRLVDGVETDRDTAFRNAAVREVFEETTVLLDVQALHHWSRWVTPEFESMRFDVQFYVAELPSGTQALDVSGEADLVTWMRPAEAVSAHEAGDLPMLPPTVETLRELSMFSSITEVMAQPRSVRPLLPRMVDVAGELLWQIIDADTLEVIVEAATPPASSESLGVQP
jgi:8-oxo-dGTP pyrophosphatase MutT (NUDIX family)